MTTTTNKNSGKKRPNNKTTPKTKTTTTAKKAESIGSKGVDSSKPKPTKPPVKKPVSKEATQKTATPATNVTKTNNAIKIDDISKLKNTGKKVEQTMDTNPDLLVKTLVTHISSIMKTIKLVDDRNFGTVQGVSQHIISELSSSGKLGRQDTRTKKLRESIEDAEYFLEDQLKAIQMLKKNF